MEIKATTALNRMASLAFRVGCPQDQLARFLNAGYVPQPRQLEFHAAARLCDEAGGPDRIGYGGTRGQAKSHATLAQAVIDDMQRCPGLKFLYLRKVQKKAFESFEDLRRKVLSGTSHEVANGVLRLPNGSFLVLGGFRTESEIDSYLGLEYDGAILEDATSLTKRKEEAIRGSVRTARLDWRPRIYESANPGGVGHAWFKKEFVDPWRDKREIDTRFIHTTLGDNVFIDQGYERFLKGLTGWLYRAWALGDFDISAGQFFNNWNEDIHVIKPLPLPWGWRYWCSMDYGFVHWNVVHLWAEDGDGKVYMVDEHTARHWLPAQHAAAIYAMLERNKLEMSRLFAFVAGPDVFAKRDSDEETIAGKYGRLGIHLTPADTDRINGAAEVLTRLGNDEAALPPTLRVFDRCHMFRETIARMQHDPARPEDVLKEDADPESGEGGDDAYDCGRYGLMAVARRRYAPPETIHA